eukprot:gene18331-24794_t
MDAGGEFCSHLAYFLAKTPIKGVQILIRHVVAARLRAAAAKDADVESMFTSLLTRVEDHKIANVNYVAFGFYAIHPNGCDNAVGGKHRGAHTLVVLRSKETPEAVACKRCMQAMERCMQGVHASGGASSAGCGHNEIV